MLPSFLLSCPAWDMLPTRREGCLSEGKERKYTMPKHRDMRKKREMFYEFCLLEKDKRSRGEKQPIMLQCLCAIPNVTSAQHDSLREKKSLSANVQNFYRYTCVKQCHPKLTERREGCPRGNSQCPRHEGFLQEKENAERREIG